MTIANLIRALAAAGATPEAIAIAVEAIEQANEVVDRQRATEAVRSRRYRERGGGKISDDLRHSVFDRDGYQCLECGSPDYLQCDHVHPVSKGGETTLHNLQTLCRVCNARKKDRIRKADFRGNSAELADSHVQNLPPSPETKVSPEPLSKTQTLSPNQLPPIVPLSPLPDAYPPSFELAWKAYPHVKGRSSKPKALAAWKRLSAEVRTALPVACSRYRAEGREPRADCGAPGMDRWLRDGRHADWIETAPDPPVVADQGLMRALTVHRLDHYRQTGEWKPSWGERPKKEIVA